MLSKTKIALSAAFVLSTHSRHWPRLNRIIAVGAGHRRADGPIYSIFEVL